MAGHYIHGSGEKPPFSTSPVKASVALIKNGEIQIKDLHVKVDDRAVTTKHGYL
jgi:hypothetical protein